MKLSMLCFCFALSLAALAQQPDPIQSVKLYPQGNQIGFPIIELGAQNALQFEFDELGTSIRNYYYSYQLCNADWSPSMLKPYEYLKGFQSQRLTTYRNSSLALVHYVHYQASLPDRNCSPSKSGNYLLRVFLDNDTNKIVLTKRLMVVEPHAAVAATVTQPFNAIYNNNAQRLNLALTLDNTIRNFGPNDIKVVVLQNQAWSYSLWLDRPTLSRGNYLTYQDDAYTSMPALREYRWMDATSFRLRSDKMASLNNKGDTTFVVAYPDQDRTSLQYRYYNDLNGGYTIETQENINPAWQGDYAWFHFSFAPPEGRAYAGRDLYMIGELTNYGLKGGKMTYNSSLGVYENTLFLKQGYYNYVYALRDPATGAFDFSKTEGLYPNGENTYQVLVYFRPFGARADQLIGYGGVSSVR